ncbi:hypothetical protein K501DRAFT_311954 [Backusella circina FSU 941]|nr:hypothetical protein K501DRAFT_311954 [Backusella circina FSU 941]
MLHINLPSLNSLILKAKGIKTDMEISDKIQPVSNLKSLKIIQHYTGSIMTAKFKQYLEAKYRHLEALSIIQPDLVLNDIAKRNANMTISLFASIGKNVSKLEFDLPSIPTDDQDFLTSMPLTHFSASLLLSEQLVSSWIVPSKLRGIQSLKLKDIPRLDFSIFRQFTELKVLELNFEEKPGGKYNVELCQVLKHDLPEKLESLGLGYTKVHIIDATRAVGASNIKELKFKRSELSSYLDGYIASHMKSLDTLFLHSCKIGFVTKKKDRFGIPRIIKDHGECRFELPSHRLKMASIEISNKHFRSGRKNDAYYELYSIPTHLKLTLGENTECYSSPRGGLDYERCGELYGTPNGRTRIGLEPFEIYSGEKGETIHDHAIQRVHDPIPSSENTRYFEFKCADVQTIYFNGCLLL